MRISSLVAAAIAGALVLMTPGGADAAAKRPYTVSISTIAAKADVGQTLTFSGKVSGAKAARKVVQLQRRVGSGAWVNVASTRTTKSRAYRVSVKVSTAGSQSFRVYAPKSKKARSGVSAARTLVGWRWLYFTEQPHQIQSYGSDSNNWIDTGTFATSDGVNHPRSFRLLINPSNWVGIAVKTEHCDRVAATISTAAGSAPLRFTSFSVSPSQDLTLPGGANQLVNLPINPAYDTNVLGFNTPSGYLTAVIAEPRQHCSVNSLSPF